MINDNLKMSTNGSNRNSLKFMIDMINLKVFSESKDIVQRRNDKNK